MEGPYTVCVALAGHSVPGPHARCAQVIRNVQGKDFNYDKAKSMIIIGLLGLLSIIVIGLIVSVIIIKLLRKHRKSCHAYYVKLHNTPNVST